MRIYIIILVAAVIMLVSGGQSELNEIKPSPKVPPKQRAIDVFILSLRWLDTACLMWKLTNHTCSYPTEKQWSIHGLWPETNGIKEPKNCNSSALFDFRQITPLKADLEAKFISVDSPNNHTSLWKYVWESYGTCGATVAEINSQFKYFKKIIELFNKYNVNDILNRNNIIVENTYRYLTVEEVSDAIENRFGKRAKVMCAIYEKEEEYYLSSINFCFDKTFKLINCDGVRGQITNCPHKKLIKYPNFQNDDTNEM